MGIWPSSTSKKNAKVWYLNKDKKMEYSLTITLKQLKALLENLTNPKKQIYVYFQWNLLTDKYNDKTL